MHLPLTCEGRRPYLCIEQPEGRELDIRCTSDTMVTSTQEVYNLQRQALNSGSEFYTQPDVNPTLTSMSWDISGSCQNPFTFDKYGRGPKPDEGKYITPLTEGLSRYIAMTVKCRKCQACQRARSHLWTDRAKVEIGLSHRTWMGTLTLNSTSQHISLERARIKADRSCVDFETLTAEEQFGLHVNSIGDDITRYIKRVRKKSEAPLRYLVVAERHKSGLPHFHCLVHEMDQNAPIKHAVLSQSWGHGFTNFKLSDHSPKSAYYVCKYLTKGMGSRVRASLFYGKSEKILRCNYNNEPSQRTRRERSFPLETKRTEKGGEASFPFSTLSRPHNVNRVNECQ